MRRKDFEKKVLILEAKLEEAYKNADLHSGEAKEHERKYLSLLEKYEIQAKYIEELEKVINILNTEKKSKIQDEIKKKIQWQRGFYDEK